jgi:hypothetical protein
MAGVNRSELQTLLVGVPLPAARGELIEYARSQGAPAAMLAALESLPDRHYRALPEVGEELAPAQPLRASERPWPRPESGAPPGGERYTKR